VTSAGCTRHCCTAARLRACERVGVCGRRPRAEAAGAAPGAGAGAPAQDAEAAQATYYARLCAYHYRRELFIAREALAEQAVAEAAARRGARCCPILTLTLTLP